MTHLPDTIGPRQEYAEFLASKLRAAPPAGFEWDRADAAPLFDWQADVVAWGCRRGRAAFFEDCGLGKTGQQAKWAQAVVRHTGGSVLILAPLAVASQTETEGVKFHVPIRQVSSGSEIDGPGVYVTNYERLHHFDATDFVGVVLDESSILKAFDGSTRNALVERFAQTPYRLCCTATPAPNDFMELGNHAEFLGVSTYAEMLAMFFVNDSGRTSQWRLKGHAKVDFWRWICSWAVNLRKPSDLGYEDNGFLLPPIRYHQHTLEDDGHDSGTLFPMQAQTLQERRQVRARTVDERAQHLARIVADQGGRWIVWCNLNSESQAATKAIPGAREVTGSQSNEEKERLLLGFTRGEFPVLVTKPSIAGFGLNWQHCHQVAFLGLSDSYEQYYQAVRRCWRFGQTSTVDVHLVTMDTEGAVVANIERKEREAMELAEGMVREMADLSSAELHHSSPMSSASYERDVATGDGWTLHLGDCVEVVGELEAGSVDFSVFSPPFASLYTYTDSVRDMGNCTDEEFAEHFRFLVGDLLRVTKPGRLCAVHCMNLPSWKWRHGVIGLRDFRGDIIRTFADAGWIYHSEVVIWKDPVTAMQRTKAIGLLYKQLRKDSAMSRQGIPDTVCVFRAPGDNPDPVSHTPDDFPLDVWQRYASPVWMDIDPTETLNYREAREDNDERHICPLQLEVIRRCLRLWSNPGDLVLSPFAGIGSEGYEALKAGRRFVGVELKRSYWETAQKNLSAAARIDQGDLFSEAG